MNGGHGDERKDRDGRTSRMEDPMDVLSLEAQEILNTGLGRGKGW